jgi:RNA polymerase sigma-70 factor (ECF subfamily)
MLTSVEINVTSPAWQQELEQLFREHYPMLYRTAYSLLGNAADAEDVPQTIFLRLLRRGSPPDMQRNAAGYLYRAAVNASLSIIRSRKHLALTSESERLEVAIHCNSPADAAAEAHQRVTELLAELAPEAAEILTLRYLHNYSDADIAKLLGTSRGAIAVRLVRVRARLRKFMQASSGEKQ